MKMINRFLLLAGFIFCIWITSCDDPNPIIIEDPAIQYGKDIEIIDDYLSQKGYTYNDTTDSGVRVVVLEEGEGTTVEEGAILTFDYTLRIIEVNSSGEIIDTTRLASTIEDVVEEFDTAQDQQVNYTYSENGWTLLFEVIGINYIVGFRDGVTSIMGLLNSEGYGEIIIPSASAYGTTGTTGVEPNTVLIFEIYLRDVQL